MSFETLLLNNMVVFDMYLTKLVIPLALIILSTFAIEDAHAADKRLRVPDFVTCDRNQLTSWQGVASKYQRDNGHLAITINTSYGTEESLKLEFDSKDALATNFRLNGLPFNENNWAEIENESGVLKDSIKVIVWVCETPLVKPIIDWKLPKR
ncbi:hypothetical protein [Psychrosphaera aestuarii]|uniref:hypothetical protein n=1 Tax=Psychrosphaera aestuarii TaxID=1266052 RepID=UPI001B3454D8|nr:hypothetical protein [Psychrosphaera aestuarii]